MEDLSKHTAIELQKLVNDCNAEHESLKSKLVEDTHEMDRIEKKINVNIEALNLVEKNYISIIAEMDKRNAL